MKDNLFQCPDCDHAPYIDARGLATHRRWKHGIKGKSAATIYARKMKKKGMNKSPAQAIWAGEYPCPHCEFVAKWKGGLAHHMKAAHKPERSTTLVKTTAKVSAVTASDNGHNPTPADTHRGLIPEATLALALGRFQGLCESIAIQHDLPPRSFAAQLADLIYATTVREPSRRSVRVSNL